METRRYLRATPSRALLLAGLTAALCVASPAVGGPSRAGQAAAATPAQAQSAVLRVQEDLAALGYLPFGWNGQAFTYPAAPLPAPLVALFAPGRDTVLLRGAIMSYEAARGLPASTGLTALLRRLEADRSHGLRASHPFTYVYVDEAEPERLLVWSPRGILESVPTNTGVAGAKTPLGTYPVYLRLPFQVMRGRNLQGVPYADPVRYISYFLGGDAVHGFARADYGFPQSLGCVEVPPWDAAAIYAQLQLGTLVTVGRGTLGFVRLPRIERAGAATPGTR